MSSAFVSVNSFFVFALQQLEKILEGNSPQRSYYNLCERVESLESKLDSIEQQLIDALVRLNGLKL